MLLPSAAIDPFGASPVLQDVHRFLVCAPPKHIPVISIGTCELSGALSSGSVKLSGVVTYIPDTWT